MTSTVQPKPRPSASFMMEPPGGSSFPPADGEAGGPRLMLPNFLRMTVAFSVNHGAVAAMLNLSVVLLGDAGSYQSGALYLSYALTALLFSPALLSVLGARSSLLLGASLYCVYVLSFSAALITPVDMAAVRFAVALVGGVVGGFAAGFLWAAQGTYFADNAKLYAIERGIDPAEANTKLASIFAGTFLGIEVALKLLPQALTPLKGIDFRVTPNGSLISAQQLVQALAYAVFAIISVFGLLSIRDLRPLLAAEAARTDPLEPPSESKRAALLGVRPPNLFAKATAAVGLWCKQPTVLLLAPIQVTFGVSASLLAYQVTSSWVRTPVRKHHQAWCACLYPSLSSWVRMLARKHLQVGAHARNESCLAECAHLQHRQTYCADFRKCHSFLLLA
uniref:Uncharacterized protein n=1 Tax=Chrysotila carterae TaxID=13221 RepID=A0A7S4BFM2_CHRCT